MTSATAYERSTWYLEKVARMFTLIEEGFEPLAGQHTRDEITQASWALWGGVHGICVLALAGTLGVTGVDSVQDLTQTLITNYLKGFTDNRVFAVMPHRKL